MESVELDMDIVGSVLSVTLSDVLYVHDCNEPCLISCRKIAMWGRFRMLVDDEIISFARKSDHSAGFIAKLMHECYQVLRLARNNKIHTVATDFWHQGLVHSSTHFLCTATHIYRDDSISPKHPSDFLYSPSNKYNCKHTVHTSGSNPQSETTST